LREICGERWGGFQSTKVIEGDMRGKVGRIPNGKESSLAWELIEKTNPGSRLSS
jgi:hypothetical protein